MDPTSPIPFRAAQAHAAYSPVSNQRQVTRPTGPTGRVVNGVIVPPLAPSTARGTAMDGPGRDRGTSAAANPDTFRLDVTSRRDHLSATLSALIAGQVDSPVGRGTGFDGDRIDAVGSRREGPSTRHHAGADPDQPLQMYTRAADRIDVATALRVGSNLDLRG